MDLLANTKETARTTIRKGPLLWFPFMVLLISSASLGCGDDTTSENGHHELDLFEDSIEEVSLDPTEDPLLDPPSDADQLSDLEPLDLQEDACLPSPFPRTAPAPDEDGDGDDDITAQLEPGQVRAGRVRDFEHGLGGVEADCRPGDIKLYNSRVAFCVAGPTSINLWTYSGGMLIDADRVGADNDRFLGLVPINSLNLHGVDEVVVVSDGSEGLAVVAVRGPEDPLRAANDILGVWLPMRDVYFETEYRLRPNVDYLEIVTWVRSEYRKQYLSMGDLIFFGDTTRTFVPGYGFVNPPEDESWTLITAISNSRSYGLYSPTGFNTQSIFVAELGGSLPAIGAISANVLVEAGQEGVMQRYLLVGEGSTPELRSQIEAISEHQTGPSAVSITALESLDEDDEVQRAIPNLYLVVSEADGGPIELVLTNDDGVVLVPLPPGDYILTPEDWVGGEVSPLPFSISESDSHPEITLELPAAAHIALNISARIAEGDPLPSPAKVQLFGPRAERFFTIDGQLDRLVRPGTYTLVVSRGEAFDAWQEVLTLAPGQSWSAEIVLDRLWDTPSMISGEFHQHMSPSIDSQVPVVDRLFSNIVEGVDFVVPSDHDAVTDFGPLIATLGIGSLIYSMPSTEVSPLSAHLNPMPMPVVPGAPGQGAIPLATLSEDGSVTIKTVPQLVAELRESYSVPIIQLNHPRRSTSAYFDTIDYDPLLGPEAVSSPHFTTDFDTIEVLNSNTSLCRVFTDWLSLIARGYHMTAVGNSDTHSLSNEAGWPRNYLFQDDPIESPAELTDQHIIDPLLSGRVVVSRGVLIDFPGGPRPGDLLDVSEHASFYLPIRVQTTSWSTIQTLEVWLGGQRVAQLHPSVPVESVVTIDEILELDRPSSDSYLFVVAWDNRPMSIVAPGQRPLGFTNPIYLDADGDGSWTPPGVTSQADLVFLDIPFCR